MFRKIRYPLPLVLLLATSSCLLWDFPFNREIREGKSVSDFTVDGDFLYFGAGYHLYRLNIPSRSIEKIYTTDRIMVEQPLIADGVAYFGGMSGANSDGDYGEKEGLFALDLQSRKIQWKFPLGVGGYGTYGTYPVIASERILVCAREHLHCLDRKSGQEMWRLDNWMGRVSDGVTLPYTYQNHVYFQIAEEHVANSMRTDENDGHWAEVSLDSGQRSIIRVAERPGTWEDSSGTGLGTLVEGIIYGKTRIDRFGALDLETRRILWEVKGNNYPRPAVNDRNVFTSRLEQIQALDRRTGTISWSIPLVEISEMNIDSSKNRVKHDYEYFWSRRFAISDEILVVQGSKGIVGLKASNGERLWLTRIESESSTVNPIIVRQMVLILSEQDCSIVALDLKTGKEAWRVKVPDCSRHYLLDD